MKTKKPAPAKNHLPLHLCQRFSLEEIENAIHDQIGFCVECGDEYSECLEPDARKIRCEVCNAPAVYGAEEILFMGLVD